MKIVTLTLNPAIDKSTTVSAIIPDKKLRCTQPTYEPGGGGINVSRALHNIKQDSLAIYLAGGATGEKMKKLLSEEKISQKAINISSDTRENFIVVDGHGQQFRFGMPGEAILASEQELILNEIKNLSSETEYLVASGSIPEGVDKTIYAQIAKICKEKNIRLILDCDGPALEEAIKEGVFLIKPNINELAALVGREEVSQDDQESMAFELINSGKVEIVAISMGPQGAMIAAKDFIEYAIPPMIKAVSTVGAGDSMVAGMTYALSKGLSLSEVIKYGVACGTASTMNPGTELCREKDVNKIIKGISFRKR